VRKAVHLLHRSLTLVSFICIASAAAGAEGAEPVRIQSEKHAFRVGIISDDLQNPWGMAFLPGGDLLVTERPGRLRLIRDGELLRTPVAGLPEITEHGQGGLLGIALHPRFPAVPWVYLSYAGAGKGGYGTEVIRGKLDGLKLVDVQRVFAAMPKSGGGRHFGSRLVFGRDGTLFISLGERGEQDYAQDLGDHRGTLVRVNEDGSVPADNPFVGMQGARPEIYTYGNRNIQGLALHPQTGMLWAHEHGPQGGDEVNILRPGVNYGWPVITYGVNYGTGTKIGEGTHKEGMAQPIYTWVPSIAPSGMTFYTGAEFPGWMGNLFVGSLKFGVLVRLELDGKRVLREERLLDGAFGRIRDVVQGPGGRLYLLTDERRGRLLVLSRAG